jgi:hypothetical protein
MLPKEITLSIAAFLDSHASLALSAPDTVGQRTILAAFLEVCYTELGLAPKFLDGDSMTEAFGQRLPRRLKTKDPLAPHAASVVEAYIDYLQTVENMAFVFEARMALHKAEGVFLKAVASSATLKAQGAQPKAFVHGASKLGRNDPCSCGSGKKFKKCHGK